MIWENETLGATAAFLLHREEYTKNLRGDGPLNQPGTLSFKWLLLGSSCIRKQLSFFLNKFNPASLLNYLAYRNTTPYVIMPFL